MKEEPPNKAGESAATTNAEAANLGISVHSPTHLILYHLIVLHFGMK